MQEDAAHYALGAYHIAREWFWMLDESLDALDALGVFDIDGLPAWVAGPGGGPVIVRAGSLLALAAAAALGALALGAQAVLWFSS